MQSTGNPDNKNLEEKKMKRNNFKRHMNVGVGFEVINGVVYVYVSDCWGKFYRRMKFGTSGDNHYNDDLVAIRITEVSE